jgi:hypothetical protein
VLENRGGGATQIGTSLVAKSKPDGHTILLVANTFTINPSLFSKLPYDSLNDLTPITYAGVTPHTVVMQDRWRRPGLRAVVLSLRDHRIDRPLQTIGRAFGRCRLLDRGFSKRVTRDLLGLAPQPNTVFAALSQFFFTVERDRFSVTRLLIHS